MNVEAVLVVAIPLALRGDSTGGAAMQLFGKPLYMHQIKINAKAPFDGEPWQWHQDYGVWARVDGMPEPRAMNISLFLDEVMRLTAR